jgi:hypothetical protein
MQTNALRDYLEKFDPNQADSNAFVAKLASVIQTGIRKA